MKKIIIILLFASCCLAVFAAGKIVKVMSFNVRMSGQMTGYSAQPFATLIKQYSPDIISFQELDYYTTRNGNKDFLNDLSNQLGMFSVFGKAIPYQGGEYGIGIASRFPITNSNLIELPSPTGTSEKRAALVATIAIAKDFTLRFVSTHLDQSNNDVRLKMVEALNSSNVIYGTDPIIAAGDFNARPTDSAISVGMQSWQRICDNTFTFNATNPTAKIDYIFGYPNLKWRVIKYEIVKNTISDHCMIYAEVEYAF